MTSIYGDVDEILRFSTIRIKDDGAVFYVGSPADYRYFIPQNVAQFKACLDKLENQFYENTIFNPVAKNRYTEACEFFASTIDDLDDKQDFIDYCNNNIEKRARFCAEIYK